MLPRAFAAVAFAAGALAGCGGEAGDLLALEVSGGPAGRELRLVVTENGRGRCGSGPLEAIESERLIEAREVERDLAELAERGASFELGSSGARRYVARTRDGTVRWPEGARGVPAVLPRAALLALRLERELCA